MGVQEKKRLRREARVLRDGLSPSYRSAADRAIAAAVRSSSAFANASLLLAYYSVGSEVDTHALIEEALHRGKTVALPRCIPNTGHMAWHAVASLDEVTPGYGGIPEPADDPATLIDARATDPDALALVPALLIDDAGFRLGYGGGYYDRFLATFPGISLGLIRLRQRVPDLRALGAVESFDLRVQGIASEEGLAIL